MELKDKVQQELEKRCADLMGRMENVYKGCGVDLLRNLLERDYPDVTEGDWIQTIALVCSDLCTATGVSQCKFMDYLCYIDEKIRRQFEIPDGEHAIENIELRMNVTDRVNNPDADEKELSALLRASTIMRSKATLGVGVLILRKTELGPKTEMEIWRVSKRDVSKKDEMALLAMGNRLALDEEYKTATEKFNAEFGAVKDE